jgi:hypothetical protein
MSSMLSVLGYSYGSVANRANPSLYKYTRSGYVPASSTYMRMSNFRPSIRNGLVR